MPVKDVNVERREGPPSNRMASPITTPFSPDQGGTLDDYDQATTDTRPADPLDYFSQHRKGRK